MGKVEKYISKHIGSTENHFIFKSKFILSSFSVPLFFMFYIHSLFTLY